ncbi:hypothetical protein C8F01DRAFT_1149276 [Mycena amicta]|nr:hypothetical protein C8F01DRAFT_1149276 [Mycena amicta]
MPQGSCHITRRSDRSPLCKTMSSFEIVMRKANEAFRTADYATATSLYTHAMVLDAKNPLTVLNRSMASLKVANWTDAEKDATSALALLSDRATDAKLVHKAYLRRARARKAVGDDDGARQDLDAYLASGGQQSVVEAESSIDLKASGEVKLELVAAPDTGFEIKTTASMGRGVFATREFHRGDMILAEKPILTVDERSTLSASYQAIQRAVEELSPSNSVKFLELTNAYDSDPLFVGIFRTNALPDGLGFDVSHFNHSCSPNARYSWHPESGRLRVFALTDIAVGAEIFVTYIQSKNVYGSPRDTRQQRIRTKFNFTCTCAACSLVGKARKASDKRRQEAGALYDGMMRHEPGLSGALVVRDAVRAITLLRNEGYHADVDDFATDAGALCAMHCDWENAKWWAQLGYETRCAEFGKDHQHANKIRKYVENPSSYPQAGMFRAGQTFPGRVL